jgi:hypothetical protein
MAKKEEEYEGKSSSTYGIGIDRRAIAVHRISGWAAETFVTDSTFTLTNDPENGQFKGAYFQVAIEQSFEVIFVKAK